MANLKLWIDNCSSDEIRGWADEDGPVEAITIEINQAWVCTLSPTMYRVDLERAGFGDGRRAYVFPLTGRLQPGRNLVAIKRGSEILYENPDVCLFSVDHPEARALSQNRWRGDEADAGLTWGAMMSGDSFVDVLATRVAWNEATRLVEIGPGYGRILEAILRRGLPFCQYIGLELSSARVLRLREQYRDPRLSFIEADVLGSIKLNETANLVFGAAVFEHFYPDFGTALPTISELLVPDGAVVFDLIREAEIGNTVFEANGTFVRWYTRREAEGLLRQHGYDPQNPIEISYGLDATHREVVRTVFVATRISNHHAAESN